MGKRECKRECKTRLEYKHRVCMWPLSLQNSYSETIRRGEAYNNYVLDFAALENSKNSA